MKYLHLFIITVVSVLALSACTQSAPAETDTSTDNTQETTNTENSAVTETTPPKETETVENPVVENEPESSLISLEELSAHNTQDNCWVAYQGEVYDITSFLPVHPGGVSRILPHCGTAQEFESAFTKKHGTSQVSKLKKTGTLKGELA